MFQPTSELIQFTSCQMEPRLRVQFTLALSVFFLVLFISFRNHNGMEINCPRSLFHLIPSEKNLIGWLLRGDGEESKSRGEGNYRHAVNVKWAPRRKELLSELTKRKHNMRCILQIQICLSFHNLFPKQITLENWSTQKPKLFDCPGVNHHTSIIV